MSRIILKYTIDPEPEVIQGVPMLVDSEILSIGMQGRSVVIWAESPDTPYIYEQKKVRDFLIVYTGVTFNMEGDYIGTVQFEDTHRGRLVCHIYEVTK